MALLVAFAAMRPAAACDLATAPTSRWGVERDGATAWLVTPCGDRFYSIGANEVEAEDVRQRDGKTWYSWQGTDASHAAWVTRAEKRLADWGFNSLGAWSAPPSAITVPQIPDLELGRNAKFHWFDPFDPAVEQTVMAKATELVAPYKGSPYRIGYYSDNEVGWWNGALFSFYQQKPASNFTKQRWVAYLKEHYDGDWQRFAVDFLPPDGVHDWDALLQSQGATRLRPGSNGIQAVRGWTGIVADHYYAVMAKALRAADPDALYFGDRLPIYYDPDAIRAEARHVDVIATNYNVDSPDGWIARYFFDGLHALSGGKPVLISEWFFAAAENRTGNLNNGHLMTVPTQAERAAGAAAAVRQFAQIPDILGIHWFEWADYPKGGRADGEDYDFGLVDIGDQPYDGLIAALAQANAAIPALHANDDPPPRQADRREIAVPYAEVDIGAKSLKDWPKSAALLPPLIAAPKEVPFGEAYLAWNLNGVALASIGQDYYDLGLLAYRGEFPLGESYRLDIGLDAGKGAHHFTLYFIPPKTVSKGTPQMTQLLCVGRAATRDSCRPVPGAASSYFGADQPRITAEALIPWSALGLDGPPASNQLRIEVAATAWHRSRWMSLSGMSPDEGRDHPKRWTIAKLGRMS